MNVALDIATVRSSAPLSRRTSPELTRPVIVPAIVCGLLQSTRTVTSAVTVPVAGETTQVCAGLVGCVKTVTLNIWFFNLLRLADESARVRGREDITDALLGNGG